MRRADARRGPQGTGRNDNQEARRVKGGSVRVIVNAECTYLPRAGVGHHTSELLGALRARTGPDAIGEYPSGVFVPMVQFFNDHYEQYQRAAERPGAMARVEALTRRGYLGALKVARNLIVPNPLAR